MVATEHAAIAPRGSRGTAASQDGRRERQQLADRLIVEYADRIPPGQVVAAVARISRMVTVAGLDDTGLRRSLCESLARQAISVRVTTGRGLLPSTAIGSGPSGPTSRSHSSDGGRGRGRLDPGPADPADAPRTSGSRRRHTMTPRSDPAVVVGVDGSESSIAAAEYAASVAAAPRQPLLLVCVIDFGGVELEAAGTVFEHHELLLEELVERVRTRHDARRVRTVVRYGHAVSTLLGVADEEEVLVVGKRGLGPVRRLLIGSTSVRAAARAHVPVVVVPDRWERAAQASGSVVVAIDPDRPHEEMLRFAFDHARRAGAPVRAIHAVDLPPVLAGGFPVTAAERRDLETRGRASVEAALKPIQEENAEVPVELIGDRGHAADVLLTHAGDAQLIVLGRRHFGPASWGLGSVARAVLHEAEVPVAVVPRRDAQTGPNGAGN